MLNGLAFHYMWFCGFVFTVKLLQVVKSSSMKLLNKEIQPSVRQTNHFARQDFYHVKSILSQALVGIIFYRK
jgi:hypothetical protein